MWVYDSAHIVVRESVKLLIRVLLPSVRCGSRTMRDVFLEVKDGKVVCCGIRWGCKCMRFRCSGQRLSRGQSAWAEERNTGVMRAWGDLGSNEKRMRDCPYVWVLCGNVTQKHEFQRKRRGENEACVLCVERRVRVTCTGVTIRQRAAMLRTTGKKGEKGFAWGSGSGVVGPGRC